MVELQEIEEKLKNSFRAVKKDIMELKANSIQIDNFKKIDNDISSLKDNFKNKIEKDADILKKINNDIKDVKEYLQFQRYPKPDKTSVKKDEDKQKGFLMKKFEEVVDILAEDED